MRKVLFFILLTYNCFAQTFEKLITSEGLNNSRKGAKIIDLIADSSNNIYALTEYLQNHTYQPSIRKFNKEFRALPAVAANDGAIYQIKIDSYGNFYCVGVYKGENPFQNKVNIQSEVKYYITCYNKYSDYKWAYVDSIPFGNLEIDNNGDCVFLKQEELFKITFNDSVPKRLFQVKGLKKFKLNDKLIYALFKDDFRILNYKKALIWNTNIDSLISDFIIGKNILYLKSSSKIYLFSKDGTKLHTILTDDILGFEGANGYLYTIQNNKIKYYENGDYIDNFVIKGVDNIKKIIPFTYNSILAAGNFQQSFYNCPFYKLINANENYFIVKISDKKIPQLMVDLNENKWNDANLSPGDSFRISYSTCDGTFDKKNVVTAYLSNDLGNFDYQIPIGSSKPDESFIDVHIPEYIAPGDKYRIKISAKTPLLLESDKNGADLKIYGLFPVELKIKGNDTLIKGGTVILEATFDSSYSYIWYRNSIHVPGNTYKYLAKEPGEYQVLIGNRLTVKYSNSVKVIPPTDVPLKISQTDSPQPDDKSDSQLPIYIQYILNTIVGSKGERPQGAIIVLALAIVFGSFIFKRNKMEWIDFTSRSNASTEFYNSIIYSFDIVIPGINLSLNDKWRPRKECWMIWSFLILFKIIGLGMSIIFLAAIGGLINV